MECTPKQMAVLRSVVRRNPDGSFMDIYQLMELHGNGASRMSMRSTLGHLEAHGMIERGGMEQRAPSKRMGKGRRVLIATEKAIAFIRPRNLPSADDE